MGDAMLPAAPTSVAVGPPVLEHVVLPVIPGREDEFLVAFAQARPIISGRPGFRSLRLSRSVEQPHEFLFLVEWDSLADHTEGFQGSPEYEQWKALLHPFYRPFPDVSHFVDV